MSDQKTDTDKAAEEQASKPAEKSAASAENKPAGKGSLFGGWLVAGLIIVSLVWYLAADRYTPYTSQARIEGYVIGVAPKVAGLVTQVWVNNNEEVEVGEPLFEVDPSQYRIALEKSQSELENARSQVEAGDAAVNSARAKLESAIANKTKAEKDFNRLSRLHKEDPGTVSIRRIEVSRATLDQAIAGVATAEAEIQRAIEQKGGNDDANNAILQSAASAVAKAELDLANTIVRASSRGVITDLRADIGQYAGTGTPVMTLIAIHDVWISAEFTENNLGRMKPGTPVEIVFDVLPGQTFDGEIRSIGLGVSGTQAPPPGTLPTVQNNRDWLRQSQRFPVVVGFDTDQHGLTSNSLRIGGQASVIAYNDSSGLLHALGGAYIRLMGWLSYAY